MVILCDFPLRYVTNYQEGLVELPEELYNNHFIDLLRPIDRTGRQSPGVKVRTEGLGLGRIGVGASLVSVVPGFFG